MTSSGLLPIPWRYVDADLARMWIWETPHFEAKVTADINSFAWELGDLIVPNQGLPRFLAEGRTTDFAEAERAVRETVGKSYPPAYGYSPYCGALATTFTIATGRRVNLGEFNGQSVVVTVRMPNGLSRSIVGYARVVNWELHVETGGSAVRVQPAHIDSIVREGGGGAAQASDSYTGVGRIYRGDPDRGCTGVASFLPGTVDHTGGTCPVHEASVAKVAPHR